MHLNVARVTMTRRAVARCPGRRCKGRLRRVWSEFAEWYGWRCTCCACGCTWEAGEIVSLSGRTSAQRVSKLWHDFRVIRKE